MRRSRQSCLKFITQFKYCVGSILDLAEFLYGCFEVDTSSKRPLCVMNTDNLPFNGDAIRGHVCSCDFTQGAPRASDFESWLGKRATGSGSWWALAFYRHIPLNSAFWLESSTFATSHPADESRVTSRFHEMADAKTKAAAFIAVTVQRACHNSFIEWAKGDNAHAQYTVSSVIFVAQVICVAIGWVLAHSTGGQADLKKCFDTGNLTRFAHIGLIYALGDIFEMESVNYIDSSTYTVLSQSKLIITASLMWILDGSAQSMMQWFILFTTSSGMLEYVLVGKAKGGAMTFSAFGVCLAIVKVCISCYVAVLNTKALKRDSNPFPVQFSCLKVSWAFASLVYMVVKDGILGDGMFGEWTHRTVVLVFCGFILKTLFNQYLLKVLDAIWKNISEAIGVILVYFGRVLFLGGKYDPTVFNAGVTVVLACIAYVLSKEGKAKKSDVGDDLNPAMYPDLTTSLLRHRRP
ncbi:hypothetical protein AK812_SmicGene25533 [Symbiodinium microadriaticum]|uniref:Uncharacterized protein n=1 Tax=Symbiodinium microadriaticum TaxID=2951 RepID=A0A1Q9DBZ0_SYMMI|nr:hypothetical protein AK812_SmicGene25533 [Symbiodinium microadriaticum]